MSASPTIFRKLGRTLVEEFARVRNEIGILERREKDLNALIKSEMTEKEIAEYAPNGCAYKLILNRTEQRRVDWESEWEKLAALHLPRWEQKKLSIQTGVEAKEVLRLSVVPNA